MRVHTVLGPGLLESAYQACLLHELRIGSLGWRLEKTRSVPDSVSLLRARGWSILSMPSAPGSSCIGIPSPLQAHLVLDKTVS